MDRSIIKDARKSGAILVCQFLGDCEINTSESVSPATASAYRRASAGDEHCHGNGWEKLMDKPSKPNHLDEVCARLRVENLRLRAEEAAQIDRRTTRFNSALREVDPARAIKSIQDRIDNPLRPIR